MLLVKTLAGAPIMDKVIESSLQKIGVVLETTAALDTDLLFDIKVSINRITKEGGNIPVCYPMPLLHLLEIAAVNEGAYHVNITNKILRGTIDISSFGTLFLGSDNIQINVTGLTVAMTLSMYSIEGDQFTDSSIKYDAVNLQANTPKKVNTEQAFGIAIPVAGFLKAEFQYSDGRINSYTAPEMEMICLDTNDLVAVWGNLTGQDAVYGYENLFVLAIENVVNVTISSSVITQFYILTDV